MNDEIGTEAVQCLFWEYINGTLVAVQPEKGGRGGHEDESYDRTKQQRFVVYFL